MAEAYRSLTPRKRGSSSEVRQTASGAPTGVLLVAPSRLRREDPPPALSLLTGRGVERRLRVPASSSLTPPSGRGLVRGRGRGPRCWGRREWRSRAGRLPGRGFGRRI